MIFYRKLHKNLAAKSIALSLLFCRFKLRSLHKVNGPFNSSHASEKKLPFYLVCLFLLVFSPISALPLPQKPYLTLDMANLIADACEQKAQSEGWRKVNIAIYDEGANLKLFRRQDGSYLHSIKIAQLKGHTSAGLPRSTRSLGVLNYKNPEKPYGIEEVPGLVIFPGGLPIITRTGYQIGGVGVSGATGDQDEQCARAGINAIRELLDLE
jgi:glc operon protein GlcG